MTQQQGVVVDESLREKQQQRHQQQHKGTNTEVLSRTKLRKHEEKQLVGVLRVLNAAEAAHHQQSGGYEDEGISKEALAQQLSPEQQRALLRRAISKLSDQGDGLSETTEPVADRRTTLRALDGQEETAFVHEGDARSSETCPADTTRLSGTERAGHAKKADIDTGFDTDTSSASDETTNVFWSSSCGGPLEPSGVIAGVSQRPTPATPVASGPHVDSPPPPPPRSPPPCFETALLRSSCQITFSGATGKRSKPSPSATLRTSRNTPAGGAKYLEGVAAAVAATAATLTRRGSSRALSSQHGEEGSRPVGASETMPIDGDTPSVVEGKWPRSGRGHVAVGAGLDGEERGEGDGGNGSSGGSAMLDGDLQVSQLQPGSPARSRSRSGGGAPVAPEPGSVPTPRTGANAGDAVRRDGGGESPRDGGGGREARERGSETSGPARARGFAALEQLPPGHSQGIPHAPHHCCTRSTPEAHVAAEGRNARVLEGAAGAQASSAEPPPAAGRVARPPSLPTPAPESQPDLLDVGAPYPAQYEKEPAPPGHCRGEVGASSGGRGRDGEPGAIPLPPAEIASSVDPASSSGCRLPKYVPLSGEHGGRHEEESNRLFSPVVATPSASAWPRGRSLPAVSATSTSCSRAELLSRKSERLEQDQAAAGVPTGEAAGARTGGDGVAEPSLEEGGVLSADRGESSLPSPPVWVTRCWDYWSTYGLVFTLSDGSVGLVFKDNAKMVVDPTSGTFDYTEAPPSPATTAVVPPSPPPSSVSREPRPRAERQGRGGGGSSCDLPGFPDPSGDSVMPTHQYRLDYFPFYLLGKVEVLRHFREHALLVDDGRRREGGRSEAAPAAAVALDRTAPLAFIEKWQIVGDTTCLQLSNKTTQVLFGDGTAILLSKDCRSVTVLDTAREIQPLGVAEHHRKDAMEERVRQAKDMVVNFLEGSPQAASEGG